MKRLLLVASLVLALPALGFEIILATLTSAGTSVSQTFAGSWHVSVQCDSPAYITVGPAGTIASSANGVLVAGGVGVPPYDIFLDATIANTVAEISVSGSTVCKVFRVVP